MIVTALTERFGLLHPIVLAPMGAVSGGRLAAAVSNAGALGLVGGGYGDRAWLARELAIVQAATAKPWGVGLITWSIGPGVLDATLAFRPHALMLSFGDPRPHADAIKAAGCVLVCQVQGFDEARLAREAGADFIVAQGTEAGGHGAHRSTLPLVPAIVDFVAPTPVIAAGGIVDGRGLAAALMLGAHGALMGTRFYASTESLAHDGGKRRMVAASGADTARTRVFDIVRDYAWPAPYTGRALRNSFMSRWDGREDALVAALDTERSAYRKATEAGEFDIAMGGRGRRLGRCGRGRGNARRAHRPRCASAASSGGGAAEVGASTNAVVSVAKRRARSRDRGRPAEPLMAGPVMQRLSTRTVRA